MKFFDTHCHLNFFDFNEDREEVIARSLENHVWVVNVGTNFESSKKAVEISQGFKEGVYAAVGLHPINIKQSLNAKSQTSKPEKLEDFLEQAFSQQKYERLLQSEKVVAVGEVGLDYWSKPKTKTRQEIFKQKQKEILEKQVQLAIELNLPVIFHCRVAHDDLIAFLKEHERFKKIKKAVIHSFVGEWEQAREYLEMGFFLGVNGIIYKADLIEVIKKVPLERILLETDAPFLAPPIFGKIRNEPIFVKEIAKTVAEIKKEKLNVVADFTFKNAVNFLGL